ncbi:MAG: hypothetical protein ACKO8I_16760 [Cyanobacteriota bacterium]
MAERNNPGVGMIAHHSAARMARPLPDRAALRLHSLSWALIAGVSALVLGLVLGLGLPAPPPAAGTAALLEPALRAGGCGFI